jgi:hypothetical protein
MRKFENKMIVIEICGHNDNNDMQEKYDETVCMFGIVTPSPVKATPVNKIYGDSVCSIINSMTNSPFNAYFTIK